MNLKNKNKFSLHIIIIFILSIVLVAVMSSSLTYYVLQKKNAPIVINQNQPVNTTGVSDENYTEKGSPYDNRTIDNATESSMVIFHGPRDKKNIAITFDAEMTDGMRANYVSGRVKSSYDKQIVDTLIATKTKATFFLTGMWIELYPHVTKEMSEDSLFELGSHSYTDSSYAGFCYGLHQLADTLKIEDIGSTEKLLREHAGIDNRLFRFPGGCYTPADVKLANSANDIVVHWDVVGADGFNTNTAQIVRNVVDNTQNGSIIVLHMNGEPTAPKTAEALPEIISKLKAKGFNFVKVSELLNLKSNNDAS